MTFPRPIDLEPWMTSLAMVAIYSYRYCTLLHMLQVIMIRFMIFMPLLVINTG